MAEAYHAGAPNRYNNEPGSLTSGTFVTGPGIVPQDSHTAPLAPPGRAFSLLVAVEGC